MKSIVVAVILLLQLPGYAQSRGENKLTQAVKELHKAMVDADRGTLEKLTDSSLSYGHSSGKVETKEEFITSLTNGSSDFSTIDITDVTINIFKNTAIVRHRLTGQTNNNGEPGNVNVGVMLVWGRVKKDWKLIARQAYKL